MFKKILTERNNKILLWIGLLIFLFGIIIFLYRENMISDLQLNSDKIAQFGDFIGGVVGSLWSLAGIILFYVALTEQRKDIKINSDALNAQVSALNQQIKEFELQREELSETREVFKEQSETLKVQRFKNTFFQLLSLHHELVDKLNFKRHKEYLEKRAVLSKAFEDLQVKITRINSIHDLSGISLFGYKPDPPETIEIAEARLYEAYKKFYFEDYRQILSHYFRNIYHIFKFVYLSDLIIKERKQFYATIIQGKRIKLLYLLPFLDNLCSSKLYTFFFFRLNLSSIFEILCKTILRKIFKF
jgi:hypothetical protein